MRLRIIASELRRLRAKSGKQQQEAAAAVDVAPNALSRYESAVSSMQPAVAEKLFRYYGLEDDEMGPLIDHVKASRRRGLTTDIKGTVWEPLEDLVAIERDATSIQETAIRDVPGLLQTEDYARALLGAGIIGADVEQHVTARMARKQVLQRDEPLDYWIVMCESSLRCGVGGRQIMQAQLAHLLELAENPDITIQILPDTYGAQPGLHGPFKIFRFKIAPTYGMVYLDYLTGALYLDDHNEVTQYDRAYRHLIKAALPEKKSMELMARTIKELYT